MKQFTRRYLILSGMIALVGGLLHIAIIFGGPSWYAFFHAPEPLVQMVREGALYPTVFCLVAAGVLLSCASYAFSGAGIILLLPFLRTGLALIATAFIFRGTAFIPLALFHSDILPGVCNCTGVDGFLVVTSGICLVAGVGYALGASELRERHHIRADLRRGPVSADTEV